MARVLLRSIPIVLVAAVAQTSVAGPTGAAAPPRVVVHGPGGKVLPNSAYPGTLPSFQERYVAEEQSWEPTIGFGPDGTAYYLATNKPANVKTGIPTVDELGGLHSEVWRSDDQGRTWTDVTPRYLPATGLSQDVDRQTQRPTISGDPYLFVDPPTGRVFSYQQQAYLLCDDWAISSTRGEEWDAYTTCPAALNGDSWGDHPTITTSRPRAHAAAHNVVHFCSSSGCRASFDGGFTWGPWIDPFPHCHDDLQLGHIKAAPDGTLYLPRKACGGAMVSVSRDDGATWRDAYVDKTVWTHSVEADPVWDHDAAVAVDTAGNAYYFWLGENRLPYLSVSRDLGRTWTKPIMVGAPAVTYALFPEITAGGNGHIAFTYLATTVASGSRDDPAATWSFDVGFSLNALSKHPVFATTAAHDPADPIRRGPCIDFRCYVEPGPRGDGVPYQGVGDFIDIRISPTTGEVWVAMVDLCNDACAQPTGTPEDPADGRAAVGVQVSGTRL